MSDYRIQRDWTDEEIQILREGREKGHSAQQIADALPWDRSRNAVLGKANRLGLKPLNNQAQPRTAPRKNSPRPRQTSKPRQSRHFEPIKPIKPEMPMSESKHLELDQLTERTCKWPFGDGPFTFCGCEKEPDAGPYCPYHKQKATAKPDTRRKAKRSLWGFNQARQPDFYQIMAEAAE